MRNTGSIGTLVDSAHYPPSFGTGERNIFSFTALVTSDNFESGTMAAPTLRGRERFSVAQLMIWHGGSLCFREDTFGSSSKGPSSPMGTSAQSSPAVIFVGPRRVDDGQRQAAVYPEERGECSWSSLLTRLVIENAREEFFGL